MVRDGRGSSNGWLIIAALVVFGGLMKATTDLGPVAIPLWAMVVAGGTIVLRGPIGKALAGRMTGELPESTGPVQLPDELYHELDDLRTRVAELEERQDFSERLLARREEPPAAG